MDVSEAVKDAAKGGQPLQTQLKGHPLTLPNDALEALGVSELQDCWHELFGLRPPPRLGPDLLRRATGYRLQELSKGGLSRQVQLHLKSAGKRPPRPSDRKTPLRITKPGTRFVREWGGEVHEVRAEAKDAFTYRGESYASLSLIARKITGTHQSGPRFFGLKRSTELGAEEQANG